MHLMSYSGTSAEICYPLQMFQRQYKISLQLCSTTIHSVSFH